MALFKKLLIANRGEIACRIIRTAQKLGIQTVAVFSEADKNALHVRMADEAYCIGPAPSKDSYLDITKIITLATQVNVQAIHPGYGFLSENPDFALACERAGIVFVGPSSSAIAMMGNKYLAKEQMAVNGIPILPDYYNEQQSAEDLFVQAKAMGFPVVLKAIAGGGGKGLRLVADEAEFMHEFYAVQREAKAFFKDDRVLLEKYLTHARHIEVQILADHFGKTHALYTRDCSIQRRHQKLIEEAPAPNLSPELLAKISTAAINAAQAIRYTNAGTIEFLVEGDEFYFMEMNTRLQVEHPVTEKITGLDLVEWQLRIAAGQRLFQSVSEHKGHAIEIRLNAEDPENDFLPSSGKLHYFKLPQGNSHLRIDSGYVQGDEVTMYYDSLLAKIIVWAETRIQAIHILQQQLASLEIFGIKTNSMLFHSILNNSNFQNAHLDTHFLRQITLTTQAPTLQLYVIAAVLLHQLQLTAQQKDSSPWSLADGWQLYDPATLHYEFGSAVTVSLQYTSGSYKAMTSEQHFTIQPLKFIPIGDNIFELQLMSNSEHMSVLCYKDDNELDLLFHSEHFHLRYIENDHQHSQHNEEQQLLAPMPGTLVALMVDSGQKVFKGDKLLVIEAMKMEHTIYAPQDGVIRNCPYKIGDLISEGAELLEFEANSISA